MTFRILRVNYLLLRTVARSLGLKGAGTNHNMFSAYRIMRVVRKTATGWNGQTPIWESIM